MDVNYPDSALFGKVSGVDIPRIGRVRDIGGFSVMGRIIVDTCLVRIFGFSSTI